jgi:nucleotide-binding universal stress UspA family protein
MSSAPQLVLSLRLKHILFATDFSPCSESALRFARALAEQFGSTIHLLHVLPTSPYAAVPPDETVLPEIELQEAEERMARMLLRNPLRHVTHEVLLRRGPLWKVFEDVCRDKDIDFIVLGTHGRRGFKKLVLGSVAEEAFRRATCPVMTIGPQLQHDGISEGRFTSIVYATDFSTGCMRALPYALGLARENHARFTLLHVLPDMPEVSPAELEQITESCRQQLENLVSPAIKLACATDIAVLFGGAAENILRVAASQHARLIVMGARRPSMGMATVHLPWATAHRVVCAAHCPVLTVRS